MAPPADLPATSQYSEFRVRVSKFARVVRSVQAVPGAA